MSALQTYRIEYWAWPAGARLSTRGEFEIAATSREDAIAACRNRWPEMHIAQRDRLVEALKAVAPFVRQEVRSIRQNYTERSTNRIEAEQVLELLNTALSEIEKAG